MMKNKFLYIAISIVSLLPSCMDEEFEPLNNVAECTWHLSTDQENVSPIKLNLNDYISIMDLSQGELSHEWTVSDNGTKFLNGKMQWGQKDYDNLVDESIPHVNDNKTIHVYFTKAGDHTIRLRNTYSKQVVYPYSEWSNEIGNYIKKYTYAKKEGDVYVMDTTFHIRVYDPNLVPGVKVFSDPECTQEIKTGIIGGTDETPEYETYELEYGKSLYLLDNSYGWPNKWKFVCQAAGFDETITDFTDKYELKLKKFSEHPLNVTLTVERTAVETDRYIPVALPKSMVIPLSIKIVPTKEPVSYDIRQIDQRHIAVSLNNSEFGYKSIDVTGLTLNYKNTFSGMEKNGTIGISSAEVSKSHRYELILELAEDIYNTDELTLKGTLPKVLAGDTDLVITADAPNITTTYGAFLDENFENPDTYGNWKVINADASPAIEPVFTEVVDNPKADGINKSPKCFSVDALEGHCRALVSKAFKGGKGTYTIKYKYYIPGAAKAGITSWFVPSDKPGQEDNTWLSTPSNQLPWAQLKAGQWVQAEGKVTSKAEMENIILSMRFNAFYGKIYFDDIFFGYIEVRP